MSSKILQIVKYCLTLSRKLKLRTIELSSNLSDDFDEQLDIDTLLNNILSERKHAKKALEEARAIAERYRKRKAVELKKRAKKAKRVARDMSESEQSINTTLEDQQNTSTFELAAKKHSADREYMHETQCMQEYMHEILPDGTTLTDLATVGNDQ